jgi:hypothetical protein
LDLDGEGTYWVQVCFDCDEPQHLTTSYKGSDFMFQVVGKRQYFHPQHKAKFATGIPSGTGYAGCAGASYKKGMIRIDNLQPNTVVCVLTDKGRYSEIRVENYDPKLQRLSISYITWEKEGPSNSPEPPH